MKYRKKPVEIEAMQWDGSEELYHFIAGHFGLKKIAANCYRDFTDDGQRVFAFEGGKFFIATLEGRMEVSPGDYVIEGVQGEFYPCKPDIFNQTYDPADA